MGNCPALGGGEELSRSGKHLEEWRGRCGVEKEEKKFENRTNEAQDNKAGSLAPDREPNRPITSGVNTTFGLRAFGGIEDQL